MLSVFRSGNATLLGIQAREAGEAPPRPLILDLAQPAYAYDMLGGRMLSHAARFTLMLPARMPVLLALSATPLTAPMFPATLTAHPGGTIRLAGDGAGQGPPLPVLRAVLRDPSGARRAQVAVAEPDGGVLVKLPDDASPGAWTIAVSDPRSGATEEIGLTVLSR